MVLRVTVVAALALSLFAAPEPAFATPEAEEARSGEQAPKIAPGVEPKRSSGRPRVVLDRLVFPEDVAGGGALERHFRHQLRRAARRADWGAGRGAKIEFRVTVEELDVREERGVLRVRCTALGRLPKGKQARSHLDYGGDPKKKRELLNRVLEIVARGVVTRLAALERARRKAARSEE